MSFRSTVDNRDNFISLLKTYTAFESDVTEKESWCVMKDAIVHIEQMDAELAAANEIVRLAREFRDAETALYKRDPAEIPYPVRPYRIPQEYEVRCSAHDALFAALDRMEDK